MTRYSPELKAQIVKKMMPPNSQSVASISRDTGISGPTLYAWKKHLKSQGYVVPTKPSSPDRWDAKTKLAAVIRTAPMNEVERSTYCREHGLYVEQLDTWKQAFEATNPLEPATSKADLAAMRKKNRKLEKYKSLGSGLSLYKSLGSGLSLCVDHHSDREMATGKYTFIRIFRGALDKSLGSGLSLCVDHHSDREMATGKYTFIRIFRGALGSGLSLCTREPLLHAILGSTSTARS